jgi:hypothetical protein
MTKINRLIIVRKNMSNCINRYLSYGKDITIHLMCIITPETI